MSSSGDYLEAKRQDEDVTPKNVARLNTKSQTA
jgi:hypothetical protein